mgnify:CR=1 FL=1
MSDADTRYKRQQQRLRNIYAKELEKHRPKVIKSGNEYKRQNLRVRDVEYLIESADNEETMD